MTLHSFKTNKNRTDFELGQRKGTHDYYKLEIVPNFGKAHMILDL